MDLKGFLDILESFGVGLILIVVLVVIGFLALLIWRLLPELLYRLGIYCLLILVIIIVLVIIYGVGKIAKKPIKNKISTSERNNSEDYKYCTKCGEKIEKEVKFCNHCGEKQD